MSSLIPQSNQSLSSQLGKEAASAPAGGGLQMPKIDPKEIWHAVLRWSWVPLLCLLIGAVGMYAFIRTLPVYYTSTGSLYIKTKAPEVFDGVGLGQEESNDLEQMKTVEQGMISSTVLLKVAEKHNLANDPLFQEVGTSQQAVFETLRDRVSVELRKGTRLIDIQVKDTDPARAAKIVEDIVTEYEIWRDGGRNDLIAKTTVGLASEEERFRKKMEESELRLQEFRAENSVLGLTGEQDPLQSGELEMLSRELSNATAERLKVEAEFRAMAAAPKENAAPMLAARGARGQLALTLESQIAAKKAEFAMLKERYLHKHPKYIDAASELARLEESLAQVMTDAKESVAEDLEVARSREQELEKLVEEAKVNAIGDETLREKFAQLTRAAEIDRSLYSQVATRLQETQIGAALSSSFLRWDEKPLIAEWPSSPNKLGLMLVGCFLGGLLGVTLALIFTLADPKVREPSAVERKLRLPLLARLPVYSRHVVDDLSIAGDGLATLNRPAHLARYTFTPREESEKMQTLLFASPFDGDGKSLCVMKCARTMVKQGYRTLVIDADFRIDGLSREYSSQRQERHGLAAYLMGEAEAAEVLFETGLPGLWFLPTGALASDTGDLLAGPGLRRLLEAIEPMFERVIFDMSSVLESDDVQAVARHLGATYLVAQKGKGKYRDLRETTEVLNSCGAQVAGFIWNEGGSRRRRDAQGPVIEPVTYPAEVREVTAPADLAEKVRARKEVG
ncbi:GumC family protein [Roseibacillus persicicus]|nr:hypothetical protein [Roseibacillus persicicus]MDQ8189154.1 hypothetical protein [Roseibacillus persicicus]